VICVLIDWFNKPWYRYQIKNGIDTKK